MGVKGFPTIKLVRPGKKAGRPMVEDYNGGRTAKAIVDAVIDKIPNHVKRLKNADYADWAAEGDLPKAILFSEKGTVGPLLKSVAIDFLGTLSVGQVRDKETEAVATFGVKKFPTLVLLPGGGKEPLTYDGELKKEAITTFLSQAASPNPDPAPSTKKAKPSKSKASAAKSASKKPSSASAATPPAECPAGKGKAASQTDETLVEDATDSPSPEIKNQERPIRVPDVAPPITQLPDGLSLQQKCLNDKAGTCVLALLPAESVPSYISSSISSSSKSTPSGSSPFIDSFIFSYSSEPVSTLTGSAGSCSASMIKPLGTFDFGASPIRIASIQSSIAVSLKSLLFK
jgi:protein disulfide-isomerase A6